MMNVGRSDGDEEKYEGWRYRYPQLRCVRPANRSGNIILREAKSSVEFSNGHRIGGKTLDEERFEEGGWPSGGGKDGKATM